MTQNLEVVCVSWIRMLKDHGRVGDLPKGQAGSRAEQSVPEELKAYTTVGLVTLSCISVTLLEPSNGILSMWNTNNPLPPPTASERGTPFHHIL